MAHDFETRRRARRKGGRNAIPVVSRADAAGDLRRVSRAGHDPRVGTGFRPPGYPAGYPRTPSTFRAGCRHSSHTVSPCGRSTRRRPCSLWSVSVHLRWRLVRSPRSLAPIGERGLSSRRSLPAASWGHRRPALHRCNPGDDRTAVLRLRVQGGGDHQPVLGDHDRPGSDELARLRRDRLRRDRGRAVGARPGRSRPAAGVALDVLGCGRAAHPEHRPARGRATRRRATWFRPWRRVSCCQPGRSCWRYVSNASILCLARAKSAMPTF